MLSPSGRIVRDNYQLKKAWFLHGHIPRRKMNYTML